MGMISFASCCPWKDIHDSRKNFSSRGALIMGYARLPLLATIHDNSPVIAQAFRVFFILRLVTLRGPDHLLSCFYPQAYFYSHI